MTTPIIAAPMLTVPDYAAHIDKSERTVRRWIADGRLEHALNTGPDGIQRIPSTAEPTAARPKADVVTLRDMTNDMTPGVPQLLTMGESLETEPAYLDLDTAAFYLGISPQVIRRNRAEFHLKPYGPHGSLVMPQHIIRQIRGER